MRSGRSKEGDSARGTLVYPRIVSHHHTIPPVSPSFSFSLLLVLPPSHSPSFSNMGHASRVQGAGLSRCSEVEPRHGPSRRPKQTRPLATAEPMRLVQPRVVARASVPRPRLCPQAVPPAPASRKPSAPLHCPPQPCCSRAVHALAPHRHYAPRAVQDEAAVLGPAPLGSLGAQGLHPRHVRAGALEQPMWVGLRRNGHLGASAARTALAAQSGASAAFGAGLAVTHKLLQAGRATGTHCRGGGSP
jgi:hypothetical protein